MSEHQTNCPKHHSFHGCADEFACICRVTPSPATSEAEGTEIQSAVNLVCNHLNEHSRELGGAGMIAEAQDYAHAASLVRRYFGDKK